MKSTLEVYREFLLKVFCLTVAKGFVGKPFCVSEKCWYQRSFAKEEYNDFVDFIFVSQYRNFSRGNLLVFHYFRVSKNVKHSRNMSRLPVENLLSHSTKKTRGRTHLCFRITLASKVFWKLGVSRSCRIFLCLTVSRVFAGEPFIVSLISCIEKF